MNEIIVTVNDVGGINLFPKPKLTLSVRRRNGYPGFGYFLGYLLGISD